MKNKGYLYVICPFFTQNRKKHPYNYAQGSQNRHLMGPMRGGLDPPLGGSPPVALWFSRGQHPESFGNRWFLPKFEHFCPFQSYFRSFSAAIYLGFGPFQSYFRPFPRRISGNFGQFSVFQGHFRAILGHFQAFQSYLEGNTVVGGSIYGLWGRKVLFWVYFGAKYCLKPLYCGFLYASHLWQFCGYTAEGGFAKNPKTRCCL